jgi:hypothetical protein
MHPTGISFLQLGASISWEHKLLQFPQLLQLNRPNFLSACVFDPREIKFDFSRLLLAVASCILG